jgi:hypothetical protein
LFRFPNGTSFMNSSTVSFGNRSCKN